MTDTPAHTGAPLPRSAAPASMTHAVPSDDSILPFQVEALDVRGRVVRLEASVDAILRRHAYPDPVSRLLGEGIALAVLLGSSLKFEGRFQLQTRTDGPVDMIIVDFEAPDRVRATARFDAEKVAALGASAKAADLLGQGHMALTIDQGPDMARYQGVVALEGGGFEEAAHQYFRQSEQIPTRVRLAVGESYVAGRGATWRAGGLLIQFLPTSPERQRQADLDPGDAPQGALEGSAQSQPQEDDAWVEARSLVATIEDHELIDPALSSERLLVRLFHERGARVFEAQRVREVCRCSRSRVLGMLARFTPEDRAHMVGEDGRVGVTCEFCSTHYGFSPEEVEREVARGEDEDARQG